MIDADNMNKVKANGTTATSRYHQPRGFFHASDKPQTPDHDFPIPGYSITTSGYKRLIFHDENIKFQASIIGQYLKINPSPTKEELEALLGDQLSGAYFDSNNRLHISCPRRGPLHLFNRANLFHTANIETHVNDLVKVCFLIALLILGNMFRCILVNFLPLCY